MVRSTPAWARSAHAWASSAARAASSARACSAQVGVEGGHGGLELVVAGVQVAQLRRHLGLAPAQLVAAGPLLGRGRRWRLLGGRGHGGMGADPGQRHHDAQRADGAPRRPDVDLALLFRPPRRRAPRAATRTSDPCRARTAHPAGPIWPDLARSADIDVTRSGSLRRLPGRPAVTSRRAPSCKRNTGPVPAM